MKTYSLIANAKKITSTFDFIIHDHHTFDTYDEMTSTFTKLEEDINAIEIVEKPLHDVFIDKYHIGIEIQIRK